MDPARLMEIACIAIITTSFGVILFTILFSIAAGNIVNRLDRIAEHMQAIRRAADQMTQTMDDVARSSQ